jgi:hypothetical protein
MRKVLNWYNTLLEHGLVDLEDEQDAAADEAEQKEEEAKKDEKAAE